MERPYWHKQTTESPLFGDLIWSRPEHRSQAGKLLIIGGSAHGFAAPAEAYAAADSAGIGACKVVLPDSLHKTAGTFLEGVEFAASNPSGSFGNKSLAELLAWSNWADATLLAGDFGRNSETAIVLEKFLTKSSNAVTLTKDAVEYFYVPKPLILERPNTLAVVTIAQLQRLAAASQFPRAITYGMDLLHLIDTLHELSQKFALHIITKQHDTMLVAVDGQVSTTKLPEDREKWRVDTAAAAATWWLQNPSKPFESLTTSLL